MIKFVIIAVSVICFAYTVPAFFPKISEHVAFHVTPSLPVTWFSLVVLAFAGLLFKFLK